MCGYLGKYLTFCLAIQRLLSCPPPPPTSFSWARVPVLALSLSLPLSLSLSSTRFTLKSMRLKCVHMYNHAHTRTHMNTHAHARIHVQVDIALFPLDTIKTRLQDPRGFAAAGGFKGACMHVCVCVEAHQRCVYLCACGICGDISQFYAGCKNFQCMYMHICMYVFIKCHFCKCTCIH